MGHGGSQRHLPGGGGHGLLLLLLGLVQGVNMQGRGPLVALKDKENSLCMVCETKFDQSLLIFISVQVERHFRFRFNTFEVFNNLDCRLAGPVG